MCLFFFTYKGKFKALLFSHILEMHILDHNCKHEILFLYSFLEMNEVIQILKLKLHKHGDEKYTVP